MNFPLQREPADERLLPPHNIPAEEAILGSLLVDPPSIARVAGSLPPEAFYLSGHQIVYRACLALHRRDLPCDLLQVRTALQDHEQLDKIGGPATLVRLFDQALTSANIDQHADLVIGKWRRRELGRLGRRLLELQHSPEAWSALYEHAEAGLFSLAEAGLNGGGLRSLAELQADFFSSLEGRSQGTTLPGITTGFYDLDAMTQGFQRGDLIIVAGRPSMGKTGFCLNIARNVALLSRKPVAVFSLEMSTGQLIARLHSSEAQIESGRLRSGVLLDNDWQRLSQSMASLGGLPIYLDDEPMPTIAHIRHECRRLKAAHGDLAWVFIDYLQLMDSSDGDNRVNRTEELSKLTRALKALARELNCPVTALSQLNREVERRTNKRPMMADLRESGAIEQDADLIMMLYRDEYYNPDTIDRGMAEVIVTKHRNGPTGVVKLLFQQEYIQFLNLART